MRTGAPCPVSIAEAILWGEQRVNIIRPRPDCFVSIAEAILWGEQPTFRVLDPRPLILVSIAEAILWGEQLWEFGMAPDEYKSFNRRGDSLGGATHRVQRL